jgi:hypothetical protein
MVGSIPTNPATPRPTPLDKGLLIDADDIAEAQGLEPGPTVKVHLGPTAAIEDDIEGLTEGTRLEVELFRTDRMPDNRFVAATLRMLLLLACPGFARSLRW